MKKTLALVLALVMVVGCLAGCSGSTTTDATTPSNTDDTANTDTSSNTNKDEAQNDESLFDQTDVNTEEMVQHDSITLNMSQFNINPLVLKSATIATYEVYEMLYQAEDGVGSKMVPVIADATRGGNNPDGTPGYDHEEGSTEYTIYIYDYITDSAGNKFTASDVVFSFEKTLEYGETSGWGVIEGWEAVDDTTVKMTCSRELNKKGELENVFLRCNMFTQAAYEASPTQFVSDGCGTGPYKITAFESDASVTLTARDDYWQTNSDLRQRCSWANVKEINLVNVSESSQLVIGVESGTLDVVTGLSSTLTEDFLDGGAYSDTLNVYSYTSNGVYYLEPNYSSESVMSDLNLRLAVFYAIDNANLVTALGENAYVKATALGPTMFQDYNSEWDTWDNYTTTSDLELAKQYLEASGYNGEEIVLLYNTGSTGIPEIIQGMLLQIGITNVTLASYDRSTASTLLSEPGEWDLYFNQTFSSDYLANVWSHIMNSDSFSSGMTEGFVDDAHYQELLQNVLTVGSDTDDYNEFWQYTLDNAIILPLCCSYSNIVYPDYITGFFLNDKSNLIPGALIYSE
jgi:ABC-type transport system substrate-binding protein